MLHLIDGRVHTDSFRCAGKRLVEVSLLHVGAESVDGLETGRGVDAEQIGTQTHVRAILLMCAVKREMAGSFVGVVGEVDVCDFGEEGAWVAGERVECEAVDD